MRKGGCFFLEDRNLPYLFILNFDKRNAIGQESFIEAKRFTSIANQQYWGELIEKRRLLKEMTKCESQICTKEVQNNKEYKAIEQ